jgi:hypothetical protein
MSEPPVSKKELRILNTLMGAGLATLGVFTVGSFLIWRNNIDRSQYY